MAGLSKSGVNIVCYIRHKMTCLVNRQGF